MNGAITVGRPGVPPSTRASGSKERDPEAEPPPMEPPPTRLSAKRLSLLTLSSPNSILPGTKRGSGSCS